MRAPSGLRASETPVRSVVYSAARARSVTVGKTALIDGAVVFETFGDPVIEEGATVRGRQTVTLPRNQCLQSHRQEMQ
ncbi:MAG TPA: hypothetical protein VKK81_22735 [Candidatus Binatia bacterium]|nr:hypothetical protein [Candidatus Binatia bacterium]